MRPADRRGLGEIVTWASILIALGILNAYYMALSAKTGKLAMDPVLMGMLSGVVAAFVARGTQGAAERSGSSESMNAAASMIREALSDGGNDRKSTEEMKAAVAMIREALAEHRDRIAVVPPASPPPIPRSGQ